MEVTHTDKVGRFFKDKAQEMSDFLEVLVGMETPSRVPTSQEQLYGFLKEKFRQLGYATLRVNGKTTGGFLYARPIERTKQNPIQLLLGHCDTVWPIGTLKNMPVESGDGRLKGPGVYDMKAGLTQIYFALMAVKELGLELTVDPVVLINSDEEIGSRESTSAIRRLAKIADRAFVLEPPLGPTGILKTARKGLARFTLTVTGKAAHAGLNPEQGVSAIVELSMQIQRLFAMNDAAKGISVNVGMIEGGMAANVIAPTSKAVVDVRVLTQEDAEDITRRILALRPSQSGIALGIEGGFGRLPMEATPRNQKLWKMAEEAGKSMGLDLAQGTAGGGSDGNTTSLYTATLDGLGTVGDGAHAAHEFIYLDKMQERATLLTLLLVAPPIEG